MRRALISGLVALYTSVVGGPHSNVWRWGETGYLPAVMPSMADIGRPEREIEVVPREAPLPQELPLEPPTPAPDEPMPIEDPVPA